MVQLLLLMLFASLLEIDPTSSTRGRAPRQLPPHPDDPNQDTPALRAEWSLMNTSTPTIALTADHQYAATLQIDLPASAVVTQDAVEAKLNEIVRWQALIVYSDPSDLPPALPFASEERTKKLGRFWMFGRPAESKQITTTAIVHAFTRPARQLPLPDVQ